MRPILALLVVVSACASAETTGAQRPGVARSQDGGDMVCHEEAVTGSMMTRQVCRSRDQEEAERKQAQEFMRERPVTPPPPPGGK